MLGSQSQYAAHQGVSRKTVTVWKRKGLLVFVDGLVDFEASDRKLHGAGRGNRQPDTETPGLVTPEELAEATVYDQGHAPHTKAEAERIKENYLALLRQLEYETKASGLGDLQEVEKTAFEKARADRDALLNWPQRIAADLGAELGVDPVALAVALERHVRAHLDERSRHALEAAG